MVEPLDEPGKTTPLVIGVTGHRHLREADFERARTQVRAFFLDLQARYPQMPLLLLSPLAEGADSLVADVALDLGLRVVAPLPLPVELYRDDFDDPQALAEFDEHLARTEVLTLPLRSEQDLGSAEAPGPARDRQYAEAGFFISRHCHILLALWDGREQASLGGTWDVVRFHLNGEVPDQLGKRPTLNLLGITENALVRHIPMARRVSPEGDSTDARWLTTRDGVIPDDAVPDAFDRMFRNQAEFNDDIGNYAQPVNAEYQCDRDGKDCPIHRLFVAADWMARTYQKRVARVLRITYVLAAATGAAFILYDQVHAQDAMIYLYLLLFGAGVLLAMLARRREWHRKYLDYRALAEGLRVQSYWRRAGVVDMEHPTHANENFMLEQDVELGWIRNVMRGANLEGLLAPTDTSEAQVDAIIDEWIGTAQSDGQLRYFTATAAKRARHHRQAEFLGHASLAVGISISVILAVFAHRWGGDIKNILVIAMGLLSVGAGVHEAYAHKKADKELVKQYRFMERIYGGARRRLDAATRVEQKREVLRLLGEAALAEHAEWTLMHRGRPLEHTRLSA